MSEEILARYQRHGLRDALSSHGADLWFLCRWP